MHTISSRGYIIVTGVSQGLGIWFAEVLANIGANRVLVARSADTLDTLTVTLRNAYSAVFHHVAQETASMSKLDKQYFRVRYTVLFEQ